MQLLLKDKPVLEISNYTGCLVPIVHSHLGVQLGKECVANGNVC